MYKVIDLFCGCGGFSEGFEKNGFDVLGIDMWDVCLKTHGGNTFQCDISKLTRNGLPAQFQEPTIIVGSPPCQTFSTANRDTRTKDPSLIKHFQRLVNSLRPKYWVWENVMGSRCVEKGVVLNAAHFGVAQRRKRNFVANFDLTALDKYHKPTTTVRQALSTMNGIGILDGYNSTVYSLDDVSPTIRRIPLKWYDGRFDDQNGQLKPPHDKRLRFTGFKMLTIQEHLILMGFNKNKKIYGKKGSQMLQIGNAVSPVVSFAIAKHLQSLLKN
jgi:DNA (cytosine-5)-methyltransferase 1